MKKTFSSSLIGVIPLRWYYVLIVLFLFVQALLFFGLGEDIYVSAHDNLDLHVADYHIMSETGSFFSKDASLPLLNGISRDYFASELSLYSLLYYLLPTSVAYICGYLLKTIIAVFSCVILAKDVLKQDYSKYEGLIVLCAFAFGILPLYPTFCFPFVSLPLVIYVLRRIYRAPDWKSYILLFFYPLLSYFTFFGFFILAYLALTCVFIWIKNKRFPASLWAALVVLSLGYIAMEYRLFGVMLFDLVPTIRETMVESSLDLKGILGSIAGVFTQGIFHADSVHTWSVLPVCLIYFVTLNLGYLKKGCVSKAWKDLFNLTMGLILFNCLIYGLYFFAPLRLAVEFVLPPLKGFQFNRTIFFNPFLWYFAFFIVLQRLLDRQYKKTAYGLAFAAILVILVTGSKYNDLYHTGFNYAYRILKQVPSNSLTYREFYSEDLFENIKADIGYSGEKSVAYGMHPAVIEYSGIFTLDGCLSYYPQSYKEEFRQIIAPSLARVESFRSYYDGWGARAYLFAGVDENVYDPVRHLEISDKNLYIDANALRDMGGKYIFSRLEITNSKELGITLRDVYTEKSSPYTIYLYDTGI